MTHQKLLKFPQIFIKKRVAPILFYKFYKFRRFFFIYIIGLHKDK